MAKKLYEEASVQDIAAAIREKTGGAETYKIAQMGNAVRGITGAEEIAWHQCPEAVRNYLADVTYDPSDYSTSQIANYAPATAVVSNHKPIGQTAGGTVHYNEVPNVLTPFASGGKAGTLKPLDRLRWINTPQAENVRDLGGWACDGGTIKYGKLFRGGEVTAADRNSLVVECGVQHELNLRGNEVAIRDYSVLGEDVRYTQFDEYDWYVGTKPNLWRKIMRVVFDCVKYNNTLYFHCQAGADRTAAVALVIEAILGVSQSDCDKDYELTCFSTGTDTDANARRRDEVSWTTSIERINAFPGSTFRDKMIAWLTTLGFTAEEINAFRTSMIDGNPETISIAVDSYSVSNELTSVTNSNNADSVDEYQSYEAELTPTDGKIINSVKITMGSVDITPAEWSGEETNRYRHVAAQLTNCSSDNAQRLVIEGQSYGANITADAGYTLEGATIHITMGGTDVSTYYSGGKIAIPKVTGDINITITAVESAHIASNILVDSFKVGGVSHTAVGYTNGKRVSTGDGTLKDRANCCVTGFIPLREGSVIRVKPYTVPSANSGDVTVCIYGADKQYSVATYVTTEVLSKNFGQCEWAQESDGVLKISCLSGNDRYIRLTIAVADGANAYVTYDAEMPSE